MKNLLVIEDDAFISRVFGEKLAAAGFHVEQVAKNRAALGRLDASTPDVVVLDLMLGDPDGIAALEYLRSRPATSATPVVALTSAYHLDLIETARRAGATKCLNVGALSTARIVEEVRASCPNGTAPSSIESVPATRDQDAPRLQVAVQREARELIARRLAEAATALPLWLRPDSPAIGAAAQKTILRTAFVIGGAAAAAGFNRVTQLADALGALLKTIEKKPAKRTASVEHTITQALDQLPGLLAATGNGLYASLLPPLVMVVDDVPLSLKVASAALERVHLRAVCVSDPHTAVGLFADNAFDLVILDVGLPGMDGLQVAARLRATTGNGHTPVIFVTAMQAEETQSGAQSFGQVDFLRKPVTVQELAVKALVQLNRRYDELQN